MPADSSKKIRATISVREICDALQISRRTFYEWKTKGKAPECWPLPNGELRIYLDVYENWLKELGREAA